jgi:hypothetical protein
MRGDGDASAGGGHPEKRSGVGAAQHVADEDAIVGREDVLDLVAHVGKRGEEALGETLVPLAGHRRVAAERGLVLRRA